MNPEQGIKVLILEDTKSDAELVKLQLDELEYQCVFKLTDKREEYARLLEEFKPDLILSDFNLPRFNGLQALEILRKQDDLTPFIFVTGTLGEENAVEAIRSGATDFIVKSRIEHLPAAIMRALREKAEKQKKKSFAKQLEAHALFLSALLKYDEWEAALVEAFQIVGEAVSVDRVYYFENSTDEVTGEKFTSQRIEWTQGSIKGQIDNPELQQLSFNMFQDFMGPLSEKRPFKAIVHQLPPSALKNNLSGQDILSLLVVPIFIEDSFYGFIGFDDCTSERIWTPNEIAFLETLSFNLAIAIEKRVSAVAVKESEQRFKTVISNIPGITYRCIADKEWTMHFISDEVERMAGYPAADFIFNKKRTYASIIHPDDLEKTYSIMNQLNGRETFHLEYRLINADGSLRWVEERGIGIYDAEGNLQCLDGVIMDVTERKKATEKFQAIFEQTSDAILLADDEGKYIDFNKAAIKMLGYAEEELMEMNVSQLIKLPSNVKFSELWNKFLNSGDQKGTFELLRKNQSKMLGSYKAAANILPGVHLTVIRDVTEMVKQKEKLLASERKFKALVQDGSDLIGILDLKGNFQFVSESTTSMLGILPQDLIGRNAFDFIHPADKERIINQLYSLKAIKQIHINPFRFRDWKDQWRMIETTATNLLNDPAVRGIVTNSRDVTEAILKKEELKISNERFEIAMKATNEMIWDWDVITDYVIRSKGFENVFGFHKSEATSTQNFWFDRIYEEDTEEVKQSIKAAFENKNQEKWNMEYRMVKGNGEIAYISDRGYIIRDDSGKSIRVVGAVLDVTESRKMIHEISQQNKALKEIAWTQSHVVRAPVARILGLANLLEIGEFDLISEKEVLRHICNSANELDNIIRQIVKKAE